jgi:hypothetical protein
MSRPVFAFGKMLVPYSVTATLPQPTRSTAAFIEIIRPKPKYGFYDYVDRDVPMLLRMFEKRLATYRAIGYARGEAPLGFAEPAEEQTIEYDQEALRHFEEDL